MEAHIYRLDQWSLKVKLENFMKLPSESKDYFGEIHTFVRAHTRFDDAFDAFTGHATLILAHNMM